MQNSFILSCESTVDMPYGYITGRGIEVLMYNYEINGEIFEDDMNRTETGLKEFYGKLSKGALPKTWAKNAFEYEDFFENLLKRGDVLHIAFGTGMTSSYQNALVAAEKMKQKYPDRKLIVVDSLCSCCGYGMLVDYAADLRDEGKTMEEIEQWVIENRNKVHHRFFATDMRHFKRSGRVTGAAATIATVLSICPMMRLDPEGKMVAYGKVRGKKNAIEGLVKAMEENARGGLQYGGKCYISNANCLDDAKKLKELVLAKFPNLPKIEIYDIGTVIGSHAGPGTLALFFMGKERE